PLTIAGGNWVQANLTNPEGYEVRLEGGNLRGLTFNGVNPTSDIDLPSWVVLAGGMLHYGWTPPQKLVPLPLAQAIVQAIWDRGGRELFDSWAKGVEIVLSGPPDMALADWKAAHIAWTEASGNAIYSGLAFRRAAAFVLQKPLDQVTEADWPALRDTLRQYDLETWLGYPTQVEG
ncbi:MAG: hypothetical protein D6706_15920, partial [Chloroflexi bacterium]